MSKQLVRFYPESQTSYSYTGTSQTRFVIADAQSVLVGRESFFQVEVYRDADGLGDFAVAFDEGGIHAAIKNIEIRMTQGGAEVQRIQHYNRLYAVLSNLHQSQDEVATLGPLYGDDVYGMLSDVSQTSGFAYMTGTVTVASPTGVVTGSGTVFTRDLRVGDYVVINKDGSVTARVLTITSDTVMSIDYSGAAIAVGATIGVLKQSSSLSSRARSVQTVNQKYILTFRLFSSFLEQNIPLMVLPGGIEILIDWENPNVCLQAIGHDGVAAHKLKIENPRFYAQMMVPSQDVTSNILAQWRSSTGLIFNIPSYKVITITRDGSNAKEDNMQMQPGVRSLRKGHFIVTSTALDEGNTEFVKQSKSLSTWLRSGITEYQARVGTHQFPHTAVEWRANENFPVNALQHLLDVNMTEKLRFTADDYYSVREQRNGLNSLSPKIESNKFIMSIDFSRDNGPGAALTGTDVSNVPLDFMVNRQTNSFTATFGAGVPKIFAFLQYDAYVQMNNQQVLVRS